MESGTLKGHIAMGAAAVIWGLMSPVSKLVMQPGEVSSASLATFRLPVSYTHLTLPTIA